MAPQVDLVKVEKAVEDSNKISEKREVVEETSPIKESTNDKENAYEEKEKDTTEDGEEVEEMDGDEGKQLSITAGPRALHKTFSLFMRSVPPNISKADIAAVSFLYFFCNFYDFWLWKCFSCSSHVIGLLDILVMEVILF